MPPEEVGTRASLTFPARNFSLKETLLRKSAAASRYLRIGPSHFIMYVFGRFAAIRSAVLLVHRIRAKSEANNPVATVLEDVDAERAADAVSKEGYSVGLRLRPEVLRSLRRFCATSTCYAEENSQFPFTLTGRSEAEERYQKTIRIGRIDNALQNCPELRALVSDSTIIAIARKYLGCQPVFLGSRIWWSFATEATASPDVSLGQGFHYDLDGYRAVAFFFYLTDVDPSTGPHICVRGSHRKKPWKGLVSLHRGRRDAEIEKWYGKENLVMLCGSAGFGFAEDIFCYHKGQHPERGDRLMLQLRYGIRSYDSPVKADGA
jgi:hypothetical protein